MIPVDQIKPFIPTHRVNRRDKSKDSRDESRNKPGPADVRRKRPPDGKHRVDELA